MASASISGEIDLEAQMARRRDDLIARKRAENELTIARIATLDTAWEDVNGDIDNDLKSGLDSARVELQAVQDAKERLTRNVCEGVNEREYALAGKLIDVKSAVGLPGLTVRMSTGAEGATSAGQQVQTDNFGDFYFAFGADATAAMVRAGKLQMLLVVLFGVDTVVHREQLSLAPKAGTVEHVVIRVDCTGKLKDVLDQGTQVADSVKSDAKLVEDRAANFETAYAQVPDLAETTLSQLRLLKRELSVEVSQPPAPPAPTQPPPIYSGPTPSPAAPAPGQPAPVDTAPPTPAPTTPDPQTPPNVKTRFLGNSHARELHDLKNTKKQCQINAIKPDYRVYFRTEREAVAAGYDFCKYCFGKQKSKR